jgi:acyl-coenzyme A thioesterase PaaI-like protein
MSDRTRTITWADPLEMAATIAELSGLERMRRVISGQLAAPPIAHLMNIRLVEADEGRVVFEGRPEEYHYNPIGMVHGGFAATILDSALEVKVSFIRPVKTTTGVVRAVGTVLHAGRTTALAEGHLRSADGILYAHSTTTCLILR